MPDAPAIDAKAAERRRRRWWFLATVIPSTLGLAVGIAITAGVAGAPALSGEPDTMARWLFTFVPVLSSLGACLALVVMGLAWIHDRRVHRLWPVLGTLAACMALLATGVVGIFFVFPAVLLACRLVAFHLKRP